jgi:hypothetical protein
MLAACFPRMTPRLTYAKTRWRRCGGTIGFTRSAFFIAVDEDALHFCDLDFPLQPYPGMCVHAFLNFWPEGGTDGLSCNLLL